MKIMRDALPNIIMSLLTMCCPITAATVATATKYSAASGGKCNESKNIAQSH